VDNNYPNKKGMKELKLGSKDLEGILDLNEFVDLEWVEL